jgi:hypothetical protein
MMELVHLWRSAMNVADVLIETSGPLSDPATWPSWTDTTRLALGEPSCWCGDLPDVPGWSATMDAMERA